MIPAETKMNETLIVLETGIVFRLVLLDQPILSNDGVIHGHHLPPSLQTADATGTPVAGSFAVLMKAYEREILVEALKNARGNMAKAARILGTTTRILSYRLQKLDIDPKPHKK